MTDTATQEKISYVYDTVGRPSETRTEKGDNIFRVLYGYDEISRPNSLIYKYNGAYTQKYSTSYIADNRITLFKLNNGQSDVFSIAPMFDTLGRQTSRTLKNGSGAQVDKEVYSFLVGAGGANASTSMVSSVGYYGSDSTVDETYTYTYDNLGNIKTVSKNGVQIAAYTYNSFNMLTGYTDADGNTYTYGYSSGKNISETGKYLLFYTDDVWLDRVTCITDDASGKVFGITYDGIGNTLSYRDGMSFTWKNGRQLATFTQGQTSASYDYNESGIRNKKTVNGVTTTFQLAGSMIVSENRNGNIIQYYYNEAGSVIGLRYNGNDYFFRRNLQGDIISILNTAGQTVVSYEYDPWGNILSTSGSMAATLGADNPFRYRGYYYDNESGLYYLQTRYYDPAVGRFINGDSQLNVSQGFLGYNMFAYCLNNPVNKYDYSGNKPGDWFSTMDEAGRDFGEYINGRSIAENREYISLIYSKRVRNINFPKIDLSKLAVDPISLDMATRIVNNILVLLPFAGKTKYSYTEPVGGAKDHVSVPANNTGYSCVAIVHSHSAFSSEYANDGFSKEDRSLADVMKVTIYVVTPLGLLWRYSPLNGSEIIVYKDLPYDSNHPLAQRRF